jgi:S1-C subfamily serine protease
MVVGINSAMIYMAQGISFAIPINTAKWVVSELITRGKVRRAYLGLVGQVRPISRRVQRYFELPQATVMEVVSIEPKTPANYAGVHVRDRIVALNGQPVSTVDDVHRLLTGITGGTLVVLTILREQKRIEIPIVVGEM